MNDNLNGWKIFLPLVAIVLLVLGNALVEGLASLIGIVAGAR